MGSVYKRGSVWWVKYYRHGRPFRESANSSKITDAKHLLALREGQVVEGRFAGLKAEKIRFDELANDYLRDYRIHGRKAIRDAERYAKLLVQAFGGRRAMDITSDSVQAFIDRRRSEGAANGTLNKELGALRRIFTLGARQQPPKVIKFPPIPRFKETNVRRGFFEHDAFLALRGALPDHQKPGCEKAKFSSCNGTNSIGIANSSACIMAPRKMMREGSSPSCRICSTC